MIILQKYLKADIFTELYIYKKAIKLITCQQSS